MKIVEYPAKVLSERGKSVEVFDDALARLINDMFEIMYAAGGVGLAASQIGLALRLFVMDCEGVKLVAANPEIVWEGGRQKVVEGCLSLGKSPASLERALKVILRSQNAKGEIYEQEAAGLAAQCLQHETDHCNGILFVDHLSPLVRDLVTKKFLKRKKKRIRG